MKKDEIEKDMNNPKNGLLKNLDAVEQIALCVGFCY